MALFFSVDKAGFQFSFHIQNVLKRQYDGKHQIKKTENRNENPQNDTRRFFPFVARIDKFWFT